MKSPAILFALIGMALLSGCGQDKQLAPDLAFNFRCSGTAYPVSETGLEKFLAAHGFTAFNEERVRRQYKLGMYPLAVDGYDSAHRMLDFRGINEKPTDKPEPTATIYSVGLYSRPPTRHDAALEKAMLAFVGDDLKCGVSHVSHGDNGAERAPFFDAIYQAEQKRIADGRRCDRDSGKPLDTKCPS
jgi:hypothetical protein